MRQHSLPNFLVRDAAWPMTAIAKRAARRLILGTLVVAALHFPWNPNLRAFTVETLRYGPEALQVGDLLRPEGSQPYRGAVMLIHGGFWRSVYTRDLMVRIAGDLVKQGLAVWNVEYRSVGSGGGYPETLQDVSQAFDWMTGGDAAERGLQGTPVAIMGHSAGGHLACWLGLQACLPMEPGRLGPHVGLRPRAVVAQGGVLDFIAAYEQNLGLGAVKALLGTAPSDSQSRTRAAWNGALMDPFLGASPNANQRYMASDPVSLIRAAAPAALATRSSTPLFGLVHGADDQIVPKEQSESLDEALRSVGAAASSRLCIIEGEAHFEHLDPGSKCWSAAIGVLLEAFA